MVNSSFKQDTFQAYQLWSNTNNVENATQKKTNPSCLFRIVVVVFVIINVYLTQFRDIIESSVFIGPTLSEKWGLFELDRKGLFFSLVNEKRKLEWRISFEIHTDSV